MKKLLALVLALIMVLSMVACSSEEAPAEETPNESEEPVESQPEEEEPIPEENYKVILIIPEKDDEIYFSSAVEGINLIKETYSNVETEIVTMGYEDMSAYDQYFTDACESGEYDLIISGTADCAEALEKAAKAYPDQLFLNYDFQAEYSDEYSNICNISYKTCDMGYLAGYLASQITVSGMEGANEDKKVGAILAFDFPALNDYIGSFCQACTDCGVQAQIGYTNSFMDPQVGYNTAMKMYNDGCDVVWVLAGMSGKGAFTAAAETGHYTFGIDVDQTLTTENEAECATIVTSFYKDYANSILNVFTMYIEGNYPAGKTVEIGFKEGGIGLVDNEQYKTLVSDEILASLEAMYEKVNSGEIVPYSVIKDPNGWEAIKAQAKVVEP